MTQDPASVMISYLVPVDVRVVKSAPERVPAGGQLLYTVQVENAGGQTATDVLLTDVLPAGLAFVSAQPSQGSCAATGQTVRCGLGPLPGGGGTQVLIAARVGRELTGRQVRNVAAVTAAELDPGTERSDDAITLIDPPVTDPPISTPPPPGSGSLAVTKTADHLVVGLGRRAGFTITVRNHSTQPVSGVVALDTPSLPVRVLSAVPQQGRCDRRSLRCELGTLAAGATVTIRVFMITRATGRLTNSVTITADSGDADAADNLAVAQVTVRAGRARFRLVKHAARAKVRAGGRVAYTIRATNTSAHAAANVRVCDTPGTGLTFTRTGSARLVRGRACWTVPYWRPGHTRSFKLHARVTPGHAGTTHNHATLHADNAPIQRATATIHAIGAPTRHGGVTG